MKPYLRRAAIALAVLVAAMLLLWQPQPAQHPDSDAPVTRTSQRSVSLAATPSLPIAAATPTVVPTGHSKRGEDIAQTTAAEYRKRARFPHWSKPIDSDTDPVASEYAVSMNPFPGPDGRDPPFTIYPQAVVFETPQAIRLYAFLGRGANREVAANVVANIRDEQQRLVVTLPLNDEGWAGDERAGDLLYSVQFDPVAQGESWKGAYTVGASALAADGSARVAATGFLYSVPGARLTGRYREALVDGSLEIEAEVDVVRPGRLHLQGSLYTQDGQPLAWAQNAASLESGRRWLALSFYGLALREAGREGPYVLRYVALASTAEMPNMKSLLVENAYLTSSYGAASFTDRPFDDPDLLEAARRLERTRGDAR